MPAALWYAAEAVYLDEGTSQQETVSQTDLNTAQNGGNSGPVSGQVGQVVGHDGSGGHGGLQHTNEGVAVHGLDDLGLSHKSQ